MGGSPSHHICCSGEQFETFGVIWAWGARGTSKSVFFCHFRKPLGKSLNLFYPPCHVLSFSLLRLQPVATLRSAETGLRPIIIISIIITLNNHNDNNHNNNGPLLKRANKASFYRLYDEESTHLLLRGNAFALLPLGIAYAREKRLRQGGVPIAAAPACSRHGGGRGSWPGQAYLFLTFLAKMTSKSIFFLTFPNGPKWINVACKWSKMAPKRIFGPFGLVFCGIWAGSPLTLGGSRGKIGPIMGPKWPKMAKKWPK